MENTLTNGLVVKLDKNNFIATVTTSKDAKGDISIPPIVEHESTKFVIAKIESFAFSQNTSLTSISIPPSVRIIEESAFYKCDQLKSLVFISNPEKDSLLEEISNFAFGDCINLEEVSPIPSSVRRIGNSSFSNCQKIKSITIEATSKSGLPPFLEEIGNAAFYSCSNLESFSTIPSTVRKIGESAFYKCSNLKSITFGSSNESKESNLKEIGKFAFADCSNLETISKIPASVYQIGESAFSNCIKLKLLSFSTYESVLEEVGNESFYNCKSLENVTFFPANARRIGKHAFCKCDNLKSFSFGPESSLSAFGLEEIGDFAFCDCLNLEKVTSIPVSLRKICNSSFYKCENLKLLTFGSSSDGSRLSSLEEIGDESFYGCSKLELVIMIPASVRKIGFSSFYQCKNLKLIIFEPKSSMLETIGSKAFYECQNLISVTMIPASVRTIGESSFYKCEKLKSVTFASAHQTGINKPSLVEIGSKSFCECSSLETVTNIPATVRRIGKKAFSKCFVLNTLNFNLNEGFTTLQMLEEISNFTFNECTSLESIFVIPKSVRRIGKAAFLKCEKLKALNFESLSSENVKSSLDEIGENAFGSCWSLEVVGNVPLSLRRICSNAFLNCTKLKSFTFDLTPPPSSSSSFSPLLNCIEASAFSGCSSLESFKTTSKCPILIGPSCFQGDELFGAIVCHSETVNIGSSCFDGCKILSFAYFPNVKELSVAEAAFNGVPESFEVFVPTEVELNGIGLEKVKNGIRTNQEPKES